jgi:hypothetical protein
MPFSGWGDLNQDFAFRLQSLINASGGRVYVTSGYRSPERQAQLWQEALRKYGDPEVADNWVARPGKSNHGHGIAADLGFANANARQWVHDNAARFGLHFPMSWEPWHIEPTGSELRSDRGAYTTPPGGFINPRDAKMAGFGADLNIEDPHDPGVQMRRLFEIMEAGPEAAQGLMASPQLEAGAESMTEALGGNDPDQAAQTGQEPQGSQGEPEAQAAAIAQGLEDLV